MAKLKILKIGDSTLRKVCRPVDKITPRILTLLDDMAETMHAADGIVLTCGERIIAFTMASRMSRDTLDVHFEKAVTDINGVYAAVNYEFARYARVKYPDIKFLDREEDMGIEGLRKAKESYYPHHLVVKYSAQKI